jgi:hypothetical protein
MMLWTPAELQAYAHEVTAFVQKAEAVANYLATNKTAVGIEHAIPHGDKLITAFGGIDNVLGMVLKDLPYVGAAFAIYQVYQDLGGKPMDANDIAKIDWDKTRDMPD